MYNIEKRGVTMKFLVSEKLSAHKYKTPEGYLVCTDAILARTGKQKYLRSEVFGDDCENANDEIEINRKPEEVFSPATLASFENKPITVEHPEEDVNAENHKAYSVGYVRDIRRGTYDGEDVMLGTLVVTDEATIEEIESGKHTELSCGYDCDIEDTEHPEQKNIRGNHVALCEQGRAGIAHIVDSVKDMSKLIKGIIFTSDKKITTEPFRGFGGKGYNILGKNVYMLSWDNGSSHASMEKDFMKNAEYFATSMNNMEVDEFDLNRLKKYAEYSNLLKSAAKKYFMETDSLNDSEKSLTPKFTKKLQKYEVRTGDTIYLVKAESVIDAVRKAKKLK